MMGIVWIISGVTGVVSMTWSNDPMQAIFGILVSGVILGIIDYRRNP